MVISIEGNQRQGRGFQIHFMDGPLDMLYDKQALDFSSATKYAGELLEQVNRERGTGDELGEVLQTSLEALEENAGRDLWAARYLHDVKSGQFEIMTPGGPDVGTAVIDGKEETVLSGRGVIELSYHTWKQEKNQVARDWLRRYCEYICTHGYQGSATKALLELDGLDKDAAVLWIKRTYARHVRAAAALIQCVTGH